MLRPPTLCLRAGSNAQYISISQSLHLIPLILLSITDHLRRESPLSMHPIHFLRLPLLIVIKILSLATVSDALPRSGRVRCHIQLAHEVFGRKTTLHFL